MIKIEITANDGGDLRAQLMALLGDQRVAIDTTTGIALTDKAAEKPAKPAEKPAKPAEAPKEEKAKPAEKAAEKPAKLDFNTDVAPVVVAAVEAHGKPLIVKVLEEFGAARASDVPSDKWPALIEAINAATAAA